MSEEEKKIIETVENFIKYYKKNEQTGNRANLDVLREECNAIEFILNKYDKQQKDIQDLLDIIKKKNEIIKKQSYTNKKLRKTLKTVRKERNKQNKIIYKMAERLAEDKEWFYSEFDNYTKQDFIEYFTNKAEESD